MFDMIVLGFRCFIFVAFIYETFSIGQTAPYVRAQLQHSLLFRCVQRTCVRVISTVLVVLINGV